MARSEPAADPHFRERVRAMKAEQLRSPGAAPAEALHTVHPCGLVHRELKPGNIITADDGPRVLDSGIARAGRTRTRTAHSLSPPLTGRASHRRSRIGPPADPGRVDEPLRHTSTEPS
ncbi:hypothetical protein ACE1SV_08530 [Streptomyces sp. E-15]